MKLIGLGKSAWPSIHSGSELEICRVPSEQLSVGELAVYCGAGFPICHRILYKRHEDKMTWFHMKGDANLESDGWIPEYRLIGRVERINGEEANLGLRRWQGLLLFRFSRLQHYLYESLFLSGLGLWLRSSRERLFPDPVFKRSFQYLTTPWLIFQPSSTKSA